MANLTPDLTLFEFTPPGQDEESQPARFRLKPLTQPQVNRLYKTFENVDDGKRQPTDETWYMAGDMGIAEILDCTIDGKRARWPQHRDVIPHTWVISAGIELCMQAWGGNDESGEDPEKN